MFYQLGSSFTCVIKTLLGHETHMLEWNIEKNRRKISLSRVLHKRTIKHKGGGEV